PDTGILNLLQVLAAAFRAGLAWVTPYPGTQRAVRRALAGKEVRRNDRRGRTRRELRKFRHRPLKIDKGCVDGHDRGGFADVGVVSNLRAQIGIELLRWKRIPVVEGEGNGTWRKPIAHFGDGRRHGDDVGVMPVDEDDLAEACFRE